MKKLINIITVLTIGLFFSCSSDNDTISNNNGMEYEFTITINGQVHKVKGNSRDGIPFSLYNNACWAQFVSGFGAMVELDIHDVTKSNYIS
jgi:hypothetical protein